MRQKITEKRKVFPKLLLYSVRLDTQPYEQKGVCVISMDVKTNTHFLNQGSKLNIKLTI